MTGNEIPLGNIFAVLKEPIVRLKVGFGVRVRVWIGVGIGVRIGIWVRIRIGVRVIFVIRTVNIVSNDGQRQILDSLIVFLEAGVEVILHALLRIKFNAPGAKMYINDVSVRRLGDKTAQHFIGDVIGEVAGIQQLLHLGHGALQLPALAQQLLDPVLVLLGAFDGVAVIIIQPLVQIPKADVRDRVVDDVSDDLLDHRQSQAGVDHQ